MSMLKDLVIYVLENSKFFDKAYLNWKRFNYPKCRKKLLKGNAAYKDRYLGERCFVIGNGPSINKCDLSLLESEYTFTVNQFPRNEGFKNVKTNFHMWADERFFDIDKSRIEDMELLEVMKSVNTNGNKPIVFYKMAAKQMIEEYQLDKDLDILYFDDMPIIGGSDKYRYIKFDEPVPRFSTVCHYLICLAVYMGFSEIYLLGCDCTGFLTLANTYDTNSAEYQYAYTMTENEKKRLARSNTKCSIQRELRWYANIFDEYEKLNDYCKYNGVKLYNATEGGVLTSIERVNFMDLFKNVQGED